MIFAMEFASHLGTDFSAAVGFLSSETPINFTGWQIQVVFGKSKVISCFQISVKMQ